MLLEHVARIVAVTAAQLGLGCSEKDATTQWRSVATEQCTEQQSPQIVVLFLLRSSTHSGGGRRGTGRSSRVGVCIISTWNATNTNCSRSLRSTGNSSILPPIHIGKNDADFRVRRVDESPHVTGSFIRHCVTRRNCRRIKDLVDAAVAFRIDESLSASVQPMRLIVALFCLVDGQQRCSKAARTIYLFAHGSARLG